MKLAKAFADIDSEETQPAETRFKGFMPIGSIEGIGKIAVTAFELIVPARKLVYHAVRFEITSGDDYPHEEIVSVSLDDAEKLKASLEVLANVKFSASRFESMEAEATVSELRVVVFNTSKNKIHAAIEANGATCHLHSQSELLNLLRFQTH